MCIEDSFMIKVVFFDIDGTILSHTTKSISCSTLDSIKKLQEKGILVVCASGRSLMEIKRLEVNNIPFDSYILLNGQLCLDKNRKKLFGCPIEGHEKELMLELFNNKKIPLQIVEQDCTYINYTNDVVNNAQAELSSPVLLVGEYSGNDIYMFTTFLNEEQINQEDFGNCRVTRWHEYGVDIVSSVGGKVNGIKKYLEMFNISLEETMAIGDGDNDIEMLKYVNIGIAMGNAEDEVKKIADYVTDDIDDDGVYKALKHFELV